jgi:nucleoid-associated protein YgaU
MAPRRLSRYTFAEAVQDDAGDLVLTGGEPFRYQQFSDTQQVVAKAGDTLWSLARRYFGGDQPGQGLPRPDGLWWVIADFQPEPIHDPTLVLEPGRVIHVPSLRTVQEVIFSEVRRR